MNSPFELFWFNIELEMVWEFSDFFLLCKCWKLFWNFPSLYTLLYCGQSAKLFKRWCACFSVQIFCFYIWNLKVSLGILKIALLFEYLIFWFLIHLFLLLGSRWSYRLVSRSVGYYWCLSDFNIRQMVEFFMGGEGMRQMIWVFIIRLEGLHQKEKIGPYTVSVKELAKEEDCFWLVDHNDWPRWWQFYT
jgi:hypothetical protein